MGDHVVGVRLTSNAPVLFCSSALHALRRGERVRIAQGQEVREGIVAIAREQIVDAPPLNDAPRVIEVIPAQSADGVIPVPSVDAIAPPDLPPGLVFLPADDGDVGLPDLARALRLAALPLPEQPPERR